VQPIATLSRRKFIAAGAGASLLSTATAGIATERSGLHAVAQRKGLSFGTCLGRGRRINDGFVGGFADPKYRALISAQCGLITPENELKWQAVRPAPDRFDFSAADVLIDWAKGQGIGVRGHTLLWHREQYFPAWLRSHDFGARPAGEAAILLKHHIGE
jgi:endo-1,4-beta-xylanase